MGFQIKANWVALLRTSDASVEAQSIYFQIRLGSRV